MFSCSLDCQFMMACGYIRPALNSAVISRMLARFSSNGGYHSRPCMCRARSSSRAASENRWCGTQAWCGQDPPRNGQASMVSWRPPRARRNAEPNRPAAPPPTKIASYSRSSSSGPATFHRPSVLSCGWSTMSSISSAHSPTVSGAPGAPRSPSGSGPSVPIRLRSAANPSPGFRTSIIADPSGACLSCLPVQHGQRAVGGGGHRGTNNRVAVTPNGYAFGAKRRSGGPGGSSPGQISAAAHGALAGCPRRGWPAAG